METDPVSVGICPLCAGHSTFNCSQGAYRIFQCEDCAFLFVHPYPTPDEVTEYYASTYRGADENFYPKLKSRKRRAFKWTLPGRREHRSRSPNWLNRNSGW